VKYLILSLALVLTGCTDHEAKIIDGLERLQKETQFNLQSCQASLSAYRNSGSSSQQETPEETTPPEPQYEETNVFFISSKDVNTSCKERNGSNSEDEADLACGMTFSDCKDGYVYRCMTNVKYKVVKEKHLIEEK
jgi:hypothetical protein